MGGGCFWDFLDVVHDDLPSLTRTGYCRGTARTLWRFVDRHAIAVIFASDGNIQWRVLRKSSGVLLQTFDQISGLPSSFDVVNFTKLEKLLTLKRMEGGRVEEDLGCRGRRGHHDGKD